MRTTTRVSAVVAAFLTLGALPAMAQSANINAVANVFQAITVTGAQTLDFGNVFPGVNKTILATAGTAGRFDLAGQISAPCPGGVHPADQSDERRQQPGDRHVDRVHQPDHQLGRLHRVHPVRYGHFDRVQRRGCPVGVCGCHRLADPSAGRQGPTPAPLP